MKLNGSPKWILLNAQSYTVACSSEIDLMSKKRSLVMSVDKVVVFARAQQLIQCMVRVRVLLGSVATELETNEKQRYKY